MEVGTYTKLLFILIGSIVALISQFILKVTSNLIDKKTNEADYLDLIVSELEDFARHCQASLQVLDAIDTTKGLPENMHFKKMYFLESSVIFQPVTFEKIHSKYAQRIYHLRLIIRNLNISIESAIARNETCEGPLQMNSFIDYLKASLTKVITVIPKEIVKLGKPQHDTEMRIRDIVNMEKVPKTILYRQKGVDRSVSKDEPQAYIPASTPDLSSPKQ